VESFHVDRFDFWQEVVCTRILEGECTRAGKDFRANISFVQLGDARLFRVSGIDFRFERREEHIRHSGQQFLTFFLQTRGTFQLVQDGRECVVGADQFACHDSTRPFQLQSSSDYEQVILQIPRSSVIESLGPAERFTALKVGLDSPLGSVAVPFLSKVSNLLCRVSPESASNLVQTAVSLVTTALAEHLSVKSNGASWAEYSLLRRAKRFIWTNCSNPALRSDDVATGLRISLRYLQQIFKDAGETPSAYIWRCRLRRCYRDLANPMFSPLSIGAIALRNGFMDMSHFSHRFRQAYRMSPRSYRAQAQRGRLK